MEKLFELMNPVQEKRLEELVKAIADEFKPLQIFCFASSLKTDVMLSCFSKPKQIEKCDYEILTITEVTGSSEDDMQKFVANFYGDGTVTILNLKKDAIKSAIENKNIYITTILEKGTILYIADGFDVQLIS